MKFDFEIKIFPVYGILLGLNYWDSDMDIVDVYEEKHHIIQIMLLFGGISFIWYSEKK